MSWLRFALIYVILLLLAFGVGLYGFILPRLFSAPQDVSVLTGGVILLLLTPGWLFALAWAFRQLDQTRTRKRRPAKEQPEVHP